MLGSYKVISFGAPPGNSSGTWRDTDGLDIADNAAAIAMAMDQNHPKKGRALVHIPTEAPTFLMALGCEQLGYALPTAIASAPLRAH